ncbi:phospholipid scramblase 2-like [Hoplias malabaricus]|uniref:phospholipid scramblase 2-like n=1 Tax=Hoplias malabaricus TaxID=27720 RepID=UPI003462875B
MSTLTAQPLPFSLEREKHIEMLVRNISRKWRPTADVQEPSTLSDYTQAHAAQNAVSSEGEGALTALRTVSQLHITAKPELQGPRCTSHKTYSIASETRQQLFVAVEESSCVCLHCCGPARSCFIQGFQQDHQPVFQFERPLRADSCCLGCCLMEMRVYTAQRELIGTVHQRWSMFTPYFEVCDAAGSSSVRIQGSCFPVRCLADQEFQVVSVIGERIGSIWKKWPGYNEPRNMDHELFGLDIPQNLCVKTKVLLLAAAFLLNLMFFEMS